MFKDLDSIQEMFDSLVVADRSDGLKVSKFFANDPSIQKEIRARRRSKGLCWCGRKPEHGMKQCFDCHSSKNRYSKARFARLKIDGLCYCGKVPPEKGFSYCRPCLDRKNSGWYERRMLSKARAKKAHEERNSRCPTS